VTQTRRLLSGCLSRSPRILNTVPPQNTPAVEEALKSVLGPHRSAYEDIPFPAAVPTRPPPEDIHTLVVVLPGFGDWDSKTLPLLEYLTTCPDAIDCAVIEDPTEVL
jgi:hypothetical protein